MVGKIIDNKSATFGFNAQTEEFVDMLQAGIIDPAKVVRRPLQDAASVAGLLITTEAMVAEAPKKEAAPAMPGGGMGAGGTTTPRRPSPEGRPAPPVGGTKELRRGGRIENGAAIRLKRIGSRLPSVATNPPNRANRVAVRSRLETTRSLADERTGCSSLPTAPNCF